MESGTAAPAARLSALPPELQLTISGFLPPWSLLALSATCKSFAELPTDDL